MLVLTRSKGGGDATVLRQTPTTGRDNGRVSPHTDGTTVVWINPAAEQRSGTNQFSILPARGAYDRAGNA